MENLNQSATKREVSDLEVEMKKEFGFVHSRLNGHDAWLERMESKLDYTVHLIQ